MKKQVLFIILSFAFSILSEAQYMVLQASQGVLTEGVAPVQGKQISETSVVVFQSGTDKLLVMDSKGLLWNISADKYTGTFPLERTVAQSISQYNSYETRGFRKTEDLVADLKLFFGAGRFTVIGEKLGIMLDDKKYPLNNDQFVVFYYKIGEKQVSKKLGFDHQKLVLEKNKLWASGEAQNQSPELRNLFVYTYQISKKESVLVTKIHLGFVAQETISKELGLVKKWCTENKIPDLEIVLSNYFSAIYGRCDIKQWNELVLQL